MQDSEEERYGVHRITGRMVNYEELRRRWTGFCWEEWRQCIIYSAMYCQNTFGYDFPDAYILEKVIEHNGEMIFYCRHANVDQETDTRTIRMLMEKGKIYEGYREGEDCDLVFENVYKDRPYELVYPDELFFSESEVIEYEQKHTWYTAKEVDYKLSMSAANRGDSEYIPADEYRKRLRLSPVAFVDYLRANRDNVPFSCASESDRHYFYNAISREGAAKMLDGISIHRLDIEKHEGFKNNLSETQDAGALDQVIFMTLTELEAARQRIADAQPAPDAAQNTGQGRAGAQRWLESVTAVCLATLEVVSSGRTNWTSGQSGAASTDSSGHETFSALLERVRRGKSPVLSQAEKAAWGVLAEKGYTWVGGRKPAKQKP